MSCPEIGQCVSANSGGFPLHSDNSTINNNITMNHWG